MKKKDEIAKLSSCLNRAEEEEPLFVLRANDELASLAVLLWAGHYRIKKMQEQGGMLMQAQQRKYEEALALAAEMKEWNRAKENGDGSDTDDS